MKPVSRNISQSLAGQNPKARGPESPMVSATRKGKASMVLPGEGGIEPAPGHMNGDCADRSAAHHADQMKRFGG
jgi:hypothetical protein